MVYTDRYGSWTCGTGTICQTICQGFRTERGDKPAVCAGNAYRVFEFSICGDKYCVSGNFPGTGCMSDGIVELIKQGLIMFG